MQTLTVRVDEWAAALAEHRPELGSTELTLASPKVRIWNEVIPRLSSPLGLLCQGSWGRESASKPL